MGLFAFPPLINTFLHITPYIRTHSYGIVIISFLSELYLTHAKHPLRGVFCSSWRFYMKHLIILSRLTLTNLWNSLALSLLQINKPVVAERRALPTEARKGIITFTLVIARLQESKGSSVKRGVFVFMWNIFKVKTKLEIQVEEYITFKEKSSPFIAADQKEIIGTFIKTLSHKDVAEITLEDLNAYHIKLKEETTNFTTIRAMQALRAFMRYHKRQIEVEPKQITNGGVVLSKVEQNAIIKPMTRKGPGRPLGDIELIKKVKRLKDKEALSFRKIGLVVGKDPSHVFKMYYYDLSQMLNK